MDRIVTKGKVKKMKKSKSAILSVIIILAATLLIAVMPTDKEAAIYDDTMRLHILANSDSREDQSLKLAIRDRVLEKYSTRLSCYENIEDAKEEMTALLPEIQGDVDLWISEMGYIYTSSIELGSEWYDTREYENFTLPKGYYTSLRILIGEGDGQNWWCVMFPPKCLDIATEEAPRDDGIIDYTKEETVLISSGGYSVKFKLLELISETFGNFRKND